MADQHQPQQDSPSQLERSTGTESPPAPDSTPPRSALPSPSASSAGGLPQQDGTAALAGFVAAQVNEAFEAHLPLLAERLQSLAVSPQRAQNDASQFLAFLQQQLTAVQQQLTVSAQQLHETEQRLHETQTAEVLLQHQCDSLQAHSTEQETLVHQLRQTVDDLETTNATLTDANAAGQAKIDRLTLLLASAQHQQDHSADDAPPESLPPTPMTRGASDAMPAPSAEPPAAPSSSASKQLVPWSVTKRVVVEVPTGAVDRNHPFVKRCMAHLTEAPARIELSKDSILQVLHNGMEPAVLTLMLVQYVNDYCRCISRRSEIDVSTILRTHWDRCHEFIRHFDHPIDNESHAYKGPLQTVYRLRITAMAILMSVDQCTDGNLWAPYITDAATLSAAADSMLMHKFGDWNTLRRSGRTADLPKMPADKDALETAEYKQTDQFASLFRVLGLGLTGPALAKGSKSGKSYSRSRRSDSRSDSRSYSRAEGSSASAAPSSSSSSSSFPSSSSSSPSSRTDRRERSPNKDRSSSHSPHSPRRSPSPNSRAAGASPSSASSSHKSS